MKQRVQWIDICKAYAIFLVVLGHYYRGAFINSYIYSFHMPLFFFLSGLVSNIEKKTFGSFLKSRAKTILLPYLVFGAIQIGLDFIKLRGTESPGIFMKRELFDLLTFSRYWFIGVLIMLELMFYFPRKYLGTTVMAVILVVCSVIGFYLNTYYHTKDELFLYTHFRTVFTAVVFYGLANLMSKKLLGLRLEEGLNSVRGTALGIGLLLVNITAYIFFYQMYGKIGIADPVNYWYFYVLSLSGIACSILFVQLFRPSFLLQYIGQSTLGIYMLHANQGIIITAVKRIGLALDLTKFSHAVFAAIIMVLLIASALYTFYEIKKIALKLSL